MVVIKGLVALKLTYILAPLVTNHKIIEEINGIFYSLLWNNKGDKIKRSVMINTYESGGLKMTSHFLTNHLRPPGSRNTLTNPTGENGHDTLKTISVKDPFLQEIVQIWSEVNFDNQMKTKQQFLELPIWHNLLIRINDNPVYYKEIFLQGISKVSHLMKDSRTFLPLPEFSNTYNI